MRRGEHLSLEASQHGTWATGILITPLQQDFCGTGWLTQTAASVATRCRWATSALQSSFCVGKLSRWAGWGCRRHLKTHGRGTSGVLFFSLLATGKKSLLSIIPKTGGLCETCRCTGLNEHQRHDWTLHALSDMESVSREALWWATQERPSSWKEWKTRQWRCMGCAIAGSHPSCSVARKSWWGSSGKSNMEISFALQKPSQEEEVTGVVSEWWDSSGVCLGAGFVQVAVTHQGNSGQGGFPGGWGWNPQGC